jgi:hypothetical protein
VVYGSKNKLIIKLTFIVILFCLKDTKNQLTGTRATTEFLCRHNTDNSTNELQKYYMISSINCLKHPIARAIVQIGPQCAMDQKVVFKMHGLHPVQLSMLEPVMLMMII